MMTKCTFKIITVFCFLLILAGCVPPEPVSEPENTPKIRVLLGNIKSEDTLQLDGVFFLESEEAAYEFGSNNKKFFIQPIKNGYKIYNENRLFRFRNHDVCKFLPESRDASFYFRSGHYKGSFTIVKREPDQLFLINTINLEDYLKSVVPAEIRTSENKFLESSKAQVICARTYALKRMMEQSNNVFDVYPDVRDQVYGTLSIQNERANKAVDATRGIVLSFNDSLASAYYHSTCGGISEDDSNVWFNSNLEYLKTRQDVLGDSFACRFSPYHRWTEKRSMKQLDSLLQIYYSRSILNREVQDTTEVQIGFQVTNRFESGRVKDLRIIISDTSLNLRTYDIRQFFGWPPGTLLPSTLFHFSSENDTTLTIEGGGAGHGVGLCQWGAMRMSEEGFLYYHILGKYFKGCYLKKLY
jgi:stage II sporulation protein D